MRATRRLALLALLLGCSARRPLPDALPGTLRIWIARHGETDWNRERRLQGWIDTPLNARGEEQARALGAELHGIAFDRVYSSTLARSRRSAEIAAPGAPIESLAGLRERSLGKFQGLRSDGSDPALEEEWARRKVDPDDALDGGESRPQHFARVAAAVAAILERHPSGTILIVGHGLTNQMVLRALLGLDDEAAAAIDQANDELYLVERGRDGRLRLLKRIARDRLGEL